MKKKKIEIFGKKVNVKSVRNRMEIRNKILNKYNKLGKSIVFSDDKNTIITKSKYNLSKGCKCCKKGTWVCLFVGLNCNSKCKFCSRSLVNNYKDEPKDFQCGMRFEQLVRKILSKNVEGVSYSGGEPFLYLDSKVIPIATLINKKRPSIYQWIYSNGKLITAKNLRRLKESGIKEVRIDLAATNFNKKIMKKLPLIKKIIGKVTIEVPSIPEVYDKLINEKNIHQLVELGVEQINLAELYISSKNAVSYIENKDIYILYKNSVSPIYSRQITFDIFKYVIKNKLPILVNDCSNDAKDLRLRTPEEVRKFCKLYN